MAFEETTPATPATPARSRYSGEGFRQEPDFREGTTAVQPATEPAESDSTVPIAKRPATPNLSYVFDDPADGEPGRDRLAVHGLWELLLALVLAGSAYLLYRQQPSALTGDGLKQLLLQVTIVGVLASGSALALRAGAVNLAVGPVAVAAAMFFAEHSGGGLLQPLLLVVGLSAAVGAVQGLAMVGLHVPPWAAGLAAAVAVLIWIQRRPAVTAVELYSAAPHAYWWLGGFCAVSVVLGLAGLVPSLRRLFGRFRPVSDPADRRGWVAALIALAVTVASSVLAGVAGVLSASLTRSSAPAEGLVVTAVGIGVALLGGTSAFGRRGGIFGTVLAAGLFAVVAAYAQARGWHWSAAALAAAALGIGLIATRLIERFGRPSLAATGDEDSDWLLPGHAADSPTSSWPAGKPYQAASPTTSTNNLWAGDDAWGTAERR